MAVHVILFFLYKIFHFVYLKSVFNSCMLILKVCDYFYFICNYLLNIDNFFYLYIRGDYFPLSMS